MIVKECREIDLTKYGLGAKDNVFFVRIDPEDLSIALQDILKELCDFSWLNKFDADYLRVSMSVNAQNTCDAIKQKFYDSKGDPVISEAGEYIVSVLSKRGVVEELGHNDVPLAELLGRKKTGNPGFDFFTEEPNLQIISCGEAKYLHGKNAYGTSLSQISDFIREKKHLGDMVILNGLVSGKSLNNMTGGNFGVSAAFSSTSISTEALITNICANEDFKKLLKFDYIVLVAVDFI